MRNTKTFPKRVFKNERHIRWNYEVSPDDSNSLRYHIVIVDDKNREGIMNSFVEKISKSGIINSPVKLIRTRQGKVEGSEYRYLFQSYDSPLKIGNYLNIRKPVRRDPELKERIKEGTSIEQYVKNEYSSQPH